MTVVCRGAEDVVRLVLADDITDNPAAVAVRIREVVQGRLRSRHHHGSSA